MASNLVIAVVLGLTVNQLPPSAPYPLLSPSDLPPPVFSGVTPVDAEPGERPIIVNVAGKRLRCRLVVSWCLPDGGRAYQVRDIETQEMVTLVRAAADDKSAEESPVRVWRWGSRTTSPRGAPVPPSAPIAIPPWTTATFLFLLRNAFLP